MRSRRLAPGPPRLGGPTGDTVFSRSGEPSRTTLHTEMASCGLGGWRRLRLGSADLLVKQSLETISKHV